MVIIFARRYIIPEMAVLSVIGVLSKQPSYNEDGCILRGAIARPVKHGGPESFASLIAASEVIKRNYESIIILTESSAERQLF